MGREGEEGVHSACVMVVCVLHEGACSVCNVCMCVCVGMVVYVWCNVCVCVVCVCGGVCVRVCVGVWVCD